MGEAPLIVALFRRAASLPRRGQGGAPGRFARYGFAAAPSSSSNRSARAVANSGSLM
jgi:hypothetical protein